MKATSLYSLGKSINKINDLDEYYDYKNDINFMENNSYVHQNNTIDHNLIAEHIINYLQNYTTHKNNIATIYKIYLQCFNCDKINKISDLNFINFNVIFFDISFSYTHIYNGHLSKKFLLHLNLCPTINKIFVKISRLIEFKAHYLSNNILQYYLINNNKFANYIFEQKHHKYLNKITLPNSVKSMFTDKTINYLLPYNLKNLQINNITYLHKRANNLKILAINKSPSHNEIKYVNNINFTKINIIELTLSQLNKIQNLKQSKFLENIDCDTLILNLLNKMNFTSNYCENEMQKKYVSKYKIHKNTQNIIINVDYNNYHTINCTKFPENINYLLINNLSKHNGNILQIVNMPKNINFFEINGFKKQDIDFDNTNIPYSILTCQNVPMKINNNSFYN
jgi:hypothetical protein